MHFDLSMAVSGLQHHQEQGRSAWGSSYLEDDASDNLYLFFEIELFLDFSFSSFSSSGPEVGFSPWLLLAEGCKSDF